MADTFLTAEELKERWRYDEVRQIYRLARAGKIPATKIGGSWRFPLKFIEEYERTQTTVPETIMKDTQT